MTSNAFVV